MNRAHADEVFRLNQETLKKQKEEKAKVMAVAKVDEAELARRQAFLRAQRELLLAKKNKERYSFLPVVVLLRYSLICFIIHG